MEAGGISQQSSFPTTFQWYQYSAPASAPTRIQRDPDIQDSPSSVGTQDLSLKKKGKYKSYSLEMKSSIVSSIEVSFQNTWLNNLEWREHIQSCGTIVITKVNCFCYQKKI
jgi:hypothetical protein